MSVIDQLFFWYILLYNKNMEKKTYLQESVKNGRLMRWNMMPLRVYIAPMKFYSKKGQDLVVDNLLSSNVNIDWKRVERTALGCCYFHFDKANRLYSAEVSIGLTEGLVHADYMDEDEVYHTILHEIGHAIGLGHSPFKKDIMYTPHQKGVLHVGEGDRLSINWLYTFPQGKSVSEIASKYGVSGSDLDEVVARIITKQAKTEFEKVKDEVKLEPERNLLEESEAIANLRKYHMSLQNVQISGELQEKIRKHYRDFNK